MRDVTAALAIMLESSPRAALETDRKNVRWTRHCFLWVSAFKRSSHDSDLTRTASVAARESPPQRHSS